MQLLMKDMTWEYTDYNTEKPVVHNNKFYSTARKTRASTTLVYTNQLDTNINKF